MVIRQWKLDDNKIRDKKKSDEESIVTLVLFICYNTSKQGVIDAKTSRYQIKPRRDDWQFE